MTKKIAVLMAEGFEEGETLILVDLFRRANFTCTTFAFDTLEVTSMHHTHVYADEYFDLEKIKTYDVLVLPGGRPGGENLMNNQDVLKLCQYFNEHKKYLCAMCFGTRVLQASNVILGRNVTGYTNYDKFLTSGNFTGSLCEVDENLITSQGPATVYPFAFTILEQLGYPCDNLKQRLLYDLR